MNLITRNQAIRRLGKYRPQTVEEVLEQCQFTLTYLSEGAFRKVYTIEGTNMILKIPLRNGGPYDEQCLYHARQEHRAWVKLRERRYKLIHQFLPSLYYFDDKYGVTLAERYDPVRREDNAKVRAMYEKLRAILGTAPNLDEQRANVGYDSRDKLRLLDLGLIKVGLLGRD